MQTPVGSGQIIRFATFELDLQAGELRKRGLRLKLRGQPFQVLAILLERPGAVITREELQKRLWPDTFVDVEHSLNTAINKIREALGDSVENPRFLETVPKRGYRFIAPLNGTPAMATSLPSHDSMQPGAEGTLLSPVLAEAPRTARRAQRYGLPYVVLFGVILVCAALLDYAVTHRPPPPRITGYRQITSDAQGKTASYANELPPPIITDGSRLYFMEGPVGGARLAEVSIGGGETAFFPAPFHIHRVLDISPNRRELLVTSSNQKVEMENPLMVLPLPAGAPHRVGDVLAHDASWSLDGRWLVYANKRDLFVARADGSEPRKLATVDGTAWWPRWSPNGTVVRFTVLDVRGWQKLWEVSADGRGLHRLFPDQSEPLVQCCGNWTPDGRYFVFASPRDTGGQIWAIREAGLLKKARDVTHVSTGPMSLVSPLPNPSGRSQFAIGVQRRGQLVRYDLNSHQFSPFLSGISATDVDLSKDGQWVTYVAFPEGTLWRSKIDGSARLQLTLPPLQVSLPRWSPDGKRIAFVDGTLGRPPKIYLVSADGGTPTKAISGEQSEGEPSWSPDGNSLLFAPWFWLGGEQETPSIHKLDLQTGRVSMVSDSAGLFSPRWSPDGRQIAALRADPSEALMLYDSGRQKWEELRKSAAFPNWSRDGRYIYFDDPYRDDPAIYRVRISDRRLERLATLDPGKLAWAIVGKWTGLGPDDSPMVLRDTSVEEIFALHWNAR